MMRQLVAALAYLHARHVCHRDIKPENILLTKAAPVCVRLADFGVATIAHPENLSALRDDPAHLACSPVPHPPIVPPTHPISYLSYPPFRARAPNLLNSLCCPRRVCSRGGGAPRAGAPAAFVPRTKPPGRSASFATPPRGHAVTRSRGHAVTRSRGHAVTRSRPPHRGRVRAPQGYGAPEVVRVEAYGTPCDVWSLGVTLAYLLTGKHPILRPGQPLDEVTLPHPRPPYCCRYPCPYCTLPPSLLLRLPVSLLYTHSLPTVAPTRVPTVRSLHPSPPPSLRSSGSRDSPARGGRRRPRPRAVRGPPGGCAPTRAGGHGGRWARGRGR